MRKIFSVVAVFVAVLFGLASRAGAGSPPVTASGAYQIPAATDDVTFVKAAGGNIFLHEVAPLDYTGDISGSALDVDNFVLHPDGTLQGAGRESCAACTIAGRTGSYVAQFMFAGSGDNYTGNLWIISSGGGLVGLHGGGFFAGTESGTGGTYTYQFVFAP